MSETALDPPNPTRGEAWDDLCSLVRRKVDEGFDSQEEIELDVAEVADDEYPTHGFRQEIKQFVGTAIEQAKEDQHDWPNETDCDLLDSAFLKLNESGIVARQNFACCQNCGHAEIGMEISAEQKRHEVRGYVFYHMQDTERAAECGDLYLAYGSLSGEQEETKLIANEIVDVLTGIGLKADWNGDTSTRIKVNLDWRRRQINLTRFLLEVIQEARKDNPNLCITLEDHENPEIWIQVTWDSINLSYPRTTHPHEELKRNGIPIPDWVEVVSWEPKKYATFSHSAEPLLELSSFTTAYTKKILGRDPIQFRYSRQFL